jgi:hypothetical protein
MLRRRIRRDLFGLAGDVFGPFDLERQRARAIGQQVARDNGQPGRRLVGLAIARPAFGRACERLGQNFLREVKIAAAAREDGEHSAVVLAHQAIEGRLSHRGPPWPAVSAG